jgi:hypothetical protein
MRKLAASILATAAVTGGVLAGTAAAAVQPSRSSHDSASVDKKSASRDRAEHRNQRERAHADHASRDR